jgi:hypothetical protein
MVSRPDGVAMLVAFRDELAKDCREAGWTVRTECLPSIRAEPGIASGELCTVERPLVVGVDATAMFGWERDHDEAGIAVTAVLGVEHKRACELLTRLSGSTVSGVAFRELAIRRSLATRSQVSAVAKELCEFVTQEYREITRRADVDSIVRMFHECRVVAIEGFVADVHAMDPIHAEHTAAQYLTALLVCAGRRNEARAALAEYARPMSDDGWAPREYRRYHRQLTRLLDDDREVSLPATPPRWVLGSDRNGPGVDDTDGLRAEVQAEAEIHVVTWIDIALPERAAYPIVGVSSERVDLMPEPGAQLAVDRVVEGGGGLYVRDAIPVPIWFSWSSDALGERSCLVVHMGKDRVGCVPGEFSERFWPVMRAAAERDEDPWSVAQVVRASGSDGYAVRVPLPNGQSKASAPSD